MTPRPSLIAGGLLLALGLTACTGGTSTPEATLVVPTGDGPVTCQEHQTGPPGTDYAGGAQADTAKVLTLLRYWNENGDKPFCDGEEATEDDAAWTDLVERLLDDEPAPVPTLEPAPTTT
jgi:hypothetical protein